MASVSPRCRHTCPLPCSPLPAPGGPVAARRSSRISRLTAQKRMSCTRRRRRRSRRGLRLPVGGLLRRGAGRTVVAQFFQPASDRAEGSALLRQQLARDRADCRGALADGRETTVAAPGPDFAARPARRGFPGEGVGGGFVHRPGPRREVRASPLSANVHVRVAMHRGDVLERRRWWRRVLTQSRLAPARLMLITAATPPDDHGEDARKNAKMRLRWCLSRSVRPAAAAWRSGSCPASRSSRRPWFLAHVIVRRTPPRWSSRARTRPRPSPRSRGSCGRCVRGSGRTGGC